jgi:hypothetical protein
MYWKYGRCAREPIIRRKIAGCGQVTLPKPETQEAGIVWE